jgi:drug/metabolite transporter (DMT)-like permease
MLAAGLLFAGMGVCVKLGAARVSPAELVFYRGIVALVMTGAIALARGTPLRTPRWRAHLNRSAWGFGSLVLYYYAIILLPLSTAITLHYTAPTFLALLLAVVFKERPGWAVLTGILLGLIGIVLLLRPAFQEGQGLGALIGLACGFGGAVTFLHVRTLGRLGEPESRTVFLFSATTTVGGAAWALMTAGFTRLDAYAGFLVVGVGGFGALAQLAVTRAYGYGKTLLAASLSYSTVVFASICGVLIFGDALSSWSSWIGMALIVMSGIMAASG